MDRIPALADIADLPDEEDPVTDPAEWADTWTAEA